MVFENKARLRPLMLPLLLMLSVLFSALPSNRSEALTRPVEVCLAARDGAEQFAKLGYDLGGIDCATVYTLLGKRTDPPRLEYSAFPPGAHINLVMLFPDDGEDHMLARIIAGKYDKRLVDFAESVQSDGRKLNLRPLLEANGHWNPWGMYHRGKDGKFDNKPEEFAPAWRHVVDVIRSVIPKESGQLTFDLDINRRSTEDPVTHIPYPLNFKVMYPGADYVDMISISSYDRCGTNPQKTEPHTFASEFAPAYYEVERIIPKWMAINIAETSKLNACGTDRMKWFYDQFVSVENKFTRIRQITYFFVTVEPGKASNNVVLHWGLDELAGEPERFAVMLARFRNEMRMPLPQYYLGNGKQLGLTWDTSVEGKKVITLPYTISGRVEGFEKEGFGGQIYTRLRGSWTQEIRRNWPDNSWIGAGISLRATGVFPSVREFQSENRLSLVARVEACKQKQIHDRKMSLQVCVFGEGTRPYYQFPGSALPGQKGWEGRFGFEVILNGDLTELWH